ncbi:MAG: hypothetical protein FWF85_06385 [Clostridiales bacterium]|jgi:hypothetical protein|nr:hypothetical protein [Clostridiales bacterium]
MKKIFVATIVLAMLVIAFTVTAFATVPEGFIEGEEVFEIDKVQYDAFDEMLYDDNNTTYTGVGGVDGINLVTNAHDGWYLEVTKKLKGDIEVAYKIGPKYYVVAFKIEGIGKYYIGEGRGANGVVHVRVSEFVPSTILVSIDPMAYFLYGFGNTGRFDYIIEIGEVIPIDWDEIYGSYFSDGLRSDYYGLTEDKVLGWWTGGAYPEYFVGARPEITADEVFFSAFFLEHGLNVITLTPEIKVEEPIDWKAKITDALDDAIGDGIITDIIYFVGNRSYIDLEIDGETYVFDGGNSKQADKSCIIDGVKYTIVITPNPWKYSVVKA